MFAVSSTSRSTGVQKLAAVNRHATFSQSTRARNTQPVTAAASADSTEAASTSDFVDDLCDADSVEFESPPVNRRLEKLRRASGRRSDMKSVRLQVAEKTVLSGRAEWAVDCRSHYDRIYDKIVYGESDP